MTRRNRKAKPAARRGAASKASEEFMARAYAMEIDAAERYGEFADQMEVHNNPEVATLFRQLAEIEGRHAKQILEEMNWPQMPPPVYALEWRTPEPPETAPVTELHYRMRPWHALALALRNEERAERFFVGVARSPKTPREVRKLAAAMAEEEREHMRLIREWMARVPQPDPDWSRDPDPPALAD
ncbi:MAG: ferritin family protein [Burkholderiales bacterium]|nr:ferritin family protein [Burkholderiales bacterium]